MADDLSLRCAICDFDHGAARRDRRIRVPPLARFVWHEDVRILGIGPVNVVDDCAIVCVGDCSLRWERQYANCGINAWLFDDCIGELRSGDAFEFAGALGLLAYFTRNHQATTFAARKVADFALRAARIPSRNK